MREWKCKQVIDFDKSYTTGKEERNRTLQQKTTDKYNRFHTVTLISAHLQSQLPDFLTKKWQADLNSIQLSYFGYLFNSARIKIIVFS